MRGTALQAVEIYKEYTTKNNTGIIIFDAIGLIDYVNETFCKLSGYTKEELIGQNEKVFNSDNQSDRYLKSLNQALNEGNIWHDKLKNKTKNGFVYWVDRTIIPFLDSDGKTEMNVNIYVDITHEEELNITHETFAIDQHSIIAKTDHRGLITYVNDNFCKISGYSKEELIGQNHNLLNSGNKEKSYWKEMYKVISRGYIWNDEVKNKNKKGEYYWVDTTIVPFLDSLGNIDCYISIRTDITKYKKIQEELKEYQEDLENIVYERTKELDKVNKKLTRLSEIDILTELPNRRKLIIDFNREIKKTNRFNRKIALYFLDLDRFKNVNDTYGHEIGDQLLKYVSENILKLLRENEYVYRIGGDEFCILIPEFNQKKELDILAQRLLKMISLIDFIGTSKIDISCSIGISIFPDDGNTLDELISEADKAMYVIKHKGKNNYHFISG